MPPRPAPLAGRADARRARAPLRDRRQLPRPRRADEPPRPGGDRGAGDGARDLRRLPRRRHARPPVPRTAVGEPYARAVRIDELRAEDWPACAGSTRRGSTSARSRRPCRRGRSGTPRISPRRAWWRATDDAILGWAALAPVSRRECYRGVTENSVYVAPRGARPGRRAGAPRASSSAAPTPRASGRSRPGILAGNDASVALHERCGFRRRRHPRADRAEARRLARRGADGAPRAVTAVSLGLTPRQVELSHVPGTVPGPGF